MQSALLQYNNCMRNKMHSQNNDMRKVREKADCVALPYLASSS